MTEIKIEKNIPLPPKARFSKWGPVADRMEIGDSVIVNDRREASALGQALITRGFKSVTRKQQDRNGTLRVWKIVK